MLDPRAKAVLDFWFRDLDHTQAYFLERTPFWFGDGGEESNKTDAYIRTHFEALLAEAVEGKLHHWEQSPKGRLALIVLLDQFSLNLYREEPRSYEYSAMAIPIAERMIAQDFDQTLSFAEKIFLYLPFEHGESIAHQFKSVALFEQLLQSVPMYLKAEFEGFLDYAVRHAVVVKKYGRFPDRNAVFGRKNTPEEDSFLASDQAPF
jgi:uncharacterized protein (DUF924 family)